MVRFLLIAALAGLGSLPGQAQGIIGDVLSGKLVKPKAGVFAWYDLTDKTEGKRYFLRQAIVGEERVKRKDGYWVETEVVPQVGYPAIYKMLLTGPASDPKHVHRVLLQEGRNPVQEIPVDPDAKDENDEKDEKDVKQTSLGKEEIALPDGKQLQAEHLQVKAGGQVTDIWVSDEVPPMGIVRLVSPEGELVLRRYGEGGQDGQSAIGRTMAAPEEDEGVKVQVNGGISTNISVGGKGP